MKTSEKETIYCLQCGFRITSNDEMCTRCGSTTIISSHGLSFKPLKTNQPLNSFFCECGRSIQQGSKVSDYATSDHRIELYMTCKCGTMSEICSDNEMDHEELNEIMKDIEFYVFDLNGNGMYVTPLKRQYEEGFNKVYNNYERTHEGLDRTFTTLPEDRIDDFESRPYIFCLLHEKTVIGFAETMDITDAYYDEIIMHEGWEDPMSIYISAIYIEPEYRGFGLGEVLVDFSSSPTYTFLTAKNEKLIKYYEGLGFKHLGEKIMVRKPVDLDDEYKE